ncbi:hypothetical protein NFI96_010095 [Prochilodus magdalenae]|nr:hypothetical protein NFI96_010095 [Prochilodus magdalenae]
MLGTKVLTLGIAGVGKTASVHKFILDWAEEKCNQDLDFILFLPFRELNLITEKQYSLWTLLLYFHDELRTADVRKILNDVCVKVLLILDGLDESKLNLDFNRKKLSDVTEKTTVDELITSLIKGELLPSALIWITCRPAAAKQIPRKYFDHVTEIRGFNDPQKEEYFRKRIRDEDQASRIISHIKTARSLYILCYIPVFCSISATVLQEMLKDDKDMNDAPTTLTEMYTRFLLFHMRQTREKYSTMQNKDSAVPPSSDRLEVEAILKLGKLAFLQLQKGQVIFYENDLKECGIGVDEAVVYSGVCTQIFKKDEKIFSFVHLSFQEFLAAVFVFLSSRDKGNPLLQTTLEKIKWMFKHKQSDLLMTAVSKAMKSENGHLDLFLRFLCGLTLETNQRLLKSLQPEMDIKEESLKNAVDYIKRTIGKKKYSDKSINLFHCLSELKDSSLASEIQRYLNSGDLSTQKLSSTEWSALVFVLLMSEETQEKFELKKYRPSDEGLRRLLPVVKNTRRALLANCNLNAESVVTLSAALQKENPFLKELDLSNNDVQDSGVEMLSDGLKSSHCKLEILRLAVCKLRQESCDALQSVLQTETSCLKELELSNNDLLDLGVEKLAVGLQSSHCKLIILRLANCNLTAVSIVTLSAALQTENSSLKELDLSNNDVQDLGVKTLSDGLKSSHCKLEILRLAVCKLSQESCDALQSVLQKETSCLKELELSNNDLLDLGVEKLAVGLQSSHCKLIILRLAMCKISKQSCGNLRTILQSETSSLKELDLSNNFLQDLGMEKLSAGLRNSYCKLEILRLSGCNFGAKSCEYLGSVLKLENSLKELDLSKNELQDSGVELLSAGLRSSHCKLQILRLSGCNFGAKSCEYLGSVLKLENSLKELDLSKNELQDSGVELLSAGLRSSHCKLQILRPVEKAVQY